MRPYPIVKLVATTAVIVGFVIQIIVDYPAVPKSLRENWGLPMTDNAWWIGGKFFLALLVIAAIWVLPLCFRKKQAKSDDENLPVSSDGGTSPSLKRYRQNQVIRYQELIDRKVETRPQARDWAKNVCISLQSDGHTRRLKQFEEETGELHNDDGAIKKPVVSGKKLLVILVEQLSSHLSD